MQAWEGRLWEASNHHTPKPHSPQERQGRWESMRLFQKKTIYGCEARGDAESAYLTRYCLIAGRFGQVAVHVFHRSDADDLHDHPWPFLSFILWRGYVEVTDEIRDRHIARIGRRKIPGMMLFRRPEHQHRVELIDGKKAVTLVVMGPIVREWGFLTSEGWKQWRRYFQEKGC